MTLEIVTQNFQLAEAKFDKKPNAETAGNLQTARRELESFIYHMTPKSEYQKNLEASQLKALIAIGESIGLSL
jgi:hypothetical protein